MRILRGTICSLYCGLAALVLAPSVHAATASSPFSPFVVDVWGAREGLPQNSVLSIVQTRDGYLWLATLNGLVRFDGVRFEVFDESTTRGLNSGRIVKLFEDRGGNLWIGTETAGIFVAQSDGDSRSLPIGLGNRDARLVSICEDESGAVWFCLANGQLGRDINGRVEVWTSGTQRPGVLHAVVAEPGDRVWVGSDRGQFLFTPASKLDPASMSPQQFLPGTNRLDFLFMSRQGGFWRLTGGLAQRIKGGKVEREVGGDIYPWGGALVTAACEDLQGNLIVGVLNEGVFWFDEQGRVTRISTAEGLSHNGVLSLCLDREGSLWVGTDGGGLNRVRRRLFEVPPESRGLVVHSLSENRSGGIWMGFSDNGATYWKGDFLRDFGNPRHLAESLSAAGGLGNPYVRSVYVDREERVWVGTTGFGMGGLYRLRQDHFYPEEATAMLRQSVHAIYQDRAGRLWFGTDGGLACWTSGAWKEYRRRDGLSAETVRAIVEDTAGNLWIGTEGGGLNRLREGRIEVIHQSGDGLPSENISALCVDSEGMLWVGTPGAGLARFHEGRWTRLTRSSGLPGNGIGYLVDDGEGWLWIGSNAGLVRLLKSSVQVYAANPTNLPKLRVFTEADGLPTRECSSGSQPAACRTADGRLLLPTIKGFVAVDPSRLTTNLLAPPVVIESVLVDGQPQSGSSIRTSPLRRLVVPPHREQLEIHFTSLNLGAPDRTLFRFQMEGHEAGWTEIRAGSERLARYPKLPPGEYRFVVKAANEDGVWNESGASLAIVVQPPFWRTKSFIAIAALALLGVIVGTVHLISTAKLRRQIRQQQAVEKDRSRIARDLHDQLGASMTQLSLLAELVEADKEVPAEVEAHAQQITQTAHQTTQVLDEIVWAVNPANDTLNGLINYICKNAQDYLNVAGLKYRFDVPAELPATPLSPEVRHNVFLAAKEAVTNVVRHSGGSSAWVRLRLDTSSFTLEIADDGRGLPETAAATTRNGLRNMRKRMEDIGGRFAISRAVEGGTLISLTAPIATRRN